MHIYVKFNYSIHTLINIVNTQLTLWLLINTGWKDQSKLDAYWQWHISRSKWPSCFQWLAHGRAIFQHSTISQILLTNDAKIMNIYLGNLCVWHQKGLNLLSSSFSIAVIPLNLWFWLYIHCTPFLLTGLLVNRTDGAPHYLDKTGFSLSQQNAVLCR